LPSKVPEVSPAFWVLTVLSTVLGASVADFVSDNLGLGVGLGMSATTAIVGLVVAATLICQLSAGRLLRGSYWLAVVVVSVLGTLVSDDLTSSLGVSPWATTAILGASLAAAFVCWFLSERTLSIHAVLTRRREAWHWLTTLCAVGLAAAVGDLTAATFHVGYAPAALVFGVLTALIGLARRLLGLNAVVVFWAAYVMIRPAGDSVTDLLTAAPREGGLGLGTLATSTTILVLVLVLLVLTPEGRAEP
jgi:uncharacterized membrane-anchored protein